MKDYVAVVYDTDRRPVTQYPVQLAEHLCRRFGLKKGDRILDNGCGRGDFLRGFVQYGLDGYGVDISDYAGECLKDIKFFKADIENGRLPFENDFFDVVFTKSVIEHFHKPDNFLKECRRVLKPGGRVIVMTPDWQSTMFIFYDDHTHVQPYTERAVLDTLNIFGFQNVRAEIFYQLPVLWRYPWLKPVSRMLQLAGPVRKIYVNKFIRWSRELMVLGTGIK